MIDIILVLLAVVVLEAAALAGILIWKLTAGERKDRKGEAPETSADGDFEKRWQEGIDAMMEYDALTARRAARRDEDEE